MEVHLDQQHGQLTVLASGKVDFPAQVLTELFGRPVPVRRTALPGLGRARVGADFGDEHLLRMHLALRLAQLFLGLGGDAAVEPDREEPLGRPLLCFAGYRPAPGHPLPIALAEDELIGLEMVDFAGGPGLLQRPQVGHAQNGGLLALEELGLGTACGDGPLAHQRRVEVRQHALVAEQPKAPRLLEGPAETRVAFEDAHE